MRVIQIKIPSEYENDSSVESIIEEFHSTLGRVCDGKDEWTDRKSKNSPVTVMIKDNFDPTLGADLTEAVEDFQQVLASYFEESQ